MWDIFGEDKPKGVYAPSILYFKAKELFFELKRSSREKKSKMVGLTINEISLFN